MHNPERTVRGRLRRAGMVFKSRLGFRLTVAVFLSILAVEAAVLVPSYANYKRDLIGRLQHVGLATASAALRSHGHSRPRDLLIAARLMDRMSEEFVGGAIYTDDGTLIGTFGEVPDLRLVQSVRTIPNKTSVAHNYRMDVLWKSAVTGLPFTLIGRLDTAWIHAELRNFILRIAGLVFLISVVVCGITLTVFGKLVLMPIFLLRDRLLTAGANPTNPNPHLVADNRSDELGDVMRAFNSMLRTTATNILELQEAKHQLTVAKETLEEAVEARTCELRATNQELRLENAERERIEAQLRHDALHDGLTGLANRAHLISELGRAICGVHDRASGHFAVMVLNVDRFRIVNDSLGHAAGDMMLRAVADRLTAALRPDDLVARTGGDEFTLVLRETDWPEGALSCVTRIREYLEAPASIRGQNVYCTVTVGLTTSALDYDDAESMMQDAKLALTKARASGGSRTGLFEQSMRSGGIGVLTRESDLRHALRDKQQLTLFYQPIVTARDGQVAGFEALLRWRHPDHGLVPPGEFIGLAEETGLISTIGAWALDQAAGQLVAWRNATSQPLFVSVNVSGRQIADNSIVHDVESVLSRHPVDPATIKLELTESSVIAHPEAAKLVLDHLKALGVKLAIDDFGTGYSSLGYLRYFPFDDLKIDRMFVRDMADEKNSQDIIHIIIDLAQKLGLGVVAEGIETVAQADALLAFGCNYLQGFHFGRPMPAEEAGDYMATAMRPAPFVIAPDSHHTVRSAIES